MPSTAFRYVIAFSCDWVNSNFLNFQAATTISDNKLSILTNRVPNSETTHPIVFPHRIHFPKTTRKLPQVLDDKCLQICAKLIWTSNLNFPISLQCLIIGVRKCGTRALLEMLNLSARVQKAAGEVHFFDRDENYLKGLDWYRKKMPHSFRGQITIEKSPSYFVTPEVRNVLT